MKTFWRSVTVVSIALSQPVVAGAQPPAGALAIDERQGDQWGWAVDYETAEAARARALRECGGGCSVVLTFARCGAYAADQDADSTAAGWAESYDSAASARQAALSECSARGGGSGCVVRAWGCNGPVVEEGLRLDRAARRQIQLGLRAGGFDPGGGGRVVRSADACRDPELADVAGVAGDGVSGRRDRGGAADGWRVGTGGCAGRAAGADRGHRGAAAGNARQRYTATGVGGAGRAVLAVDHEQHEPGGVRGVSAAVPERCVPNTGAGAAGGAAITGGHTAGGVRTACRGRDGGGRRRGLASGAGVPGLRGLPGDGGGAGGFVPDGLRLGAGPELPGQRVPGARGAGGSIRAGSLRGAVRGVRPLRGGDGPRAPGR